MVYGLKDSPFALDQGHPFSSRNRHTCASSRNNTDIVAEIYYKLRELLPHHSTTHIFLVVITNNKCKFSFSSMSLK
jgi:hypothetical protein